ncbi:MAG: hypothetical protein V4634_18160 [Pseudomonadota bacterium]
MTIKVRMIAREYFLGANYLIDPGALFAKLRPACQSIAIRQIAQAAVFAKFRQDRQNLSSTGINILLKDANKQG